MIHKLLLTVTAIAISQLPQQVQSSASEQNLTIQAHQAGQDIYVFINSNGTGLKYTGTLNPAMTASTFVKGSHFVVIPDVSNITGSTLDLGLGPVAMQGTCNQACFIIVDGPSGNPTGLYLVH